MNHKAHKAKHLPKGKTDLPLATANIRVHTLNMDVLMIADGLGYQSWQSVGVKLQLVTSPHDEQGTLPLRSLDIS